MCMKGTSDSSSCHRLGVYGHRCLGAWLFWHCLTMTSHPRPSRLFFNVQHWKTGSNLGTRLLAAYIDLAKSKLTPDVPVYTIWSAWLCKLCLWFSVYTTNFCKISANCLVSYPGISMFFNMREKHREGQIDQAFPIFVAGIEKHGRAWVKATNYCTVVLQVSCPATREDL